MINVPENELFSAYLDGELTAAEQADIERLLATSPAARQLLEELRALSSTLQSLPAHKLDEDLSQQVLRLAEQRTLSGQTDSDPFPQDPVVPSSRWRAVARRLSQPRIWVWPGLAVSVAILLMVLQPEQVRRVAQPLAEKHVALAPATAPSAAAEPAAIGALAEADREATGDAYHMAAKSRAGGERLDLAKQSAYGSRPMDRVIREEEESPRPAAMPSTQAAPRTPASAPKTTAPAANKALAATLEDGSSATEAKPAEAMARPMKAAKPGVPAGTVAAREKTVEAVRKAAAEQVLVVHCDVTPQAVELRIVEQVLANRQVLLAVTPAKEGLDRDRAAGRRVGRIEKAEAKPEAIRQEAGQAEPADKLAVDAKKDAGKMDAGKMDAGKMDAGKMDAGKMDAGKMVYLHAEATPAQLEAVLADLKARPEMIRSLSSVSVVDGGGAYGESRGVFAGKAAPEMKMKGFAAADPPPRSGMAGYDVSGRPAERSQRLEMNYQANVKNQPTMADSVEGAAAANQMRNTQIQAGMANSATTANQSQNVQSPPGMPGAAGGMGVAGPSQVAGSQKTFGGGMGGRMPAKSAEAMFGQQAMPGQMTQRAIDATQAGGTRIASPGSMPALSQTQSQRQPGDKCRVVFVLRAVDPTPIAAEKTGKAPLAEAKSAAGAKPAPARAEAATPAAPAKPAASTQPAPSAAK